MNGCIVKRVITTDNAEEACRLFKRLAAKAWDFKKFLAGAEIAVCSTVFDNILGKGRSKARYVGKYLLCCSIEVDTNLVHTALNNHVKTLLEFCLVHAMLVLPHSN